MQDSDNPRLSRIRRRAEKSKAQLFQSSGQTCPDRQDPFSDLLDAHLEQEFDGSFHPGDSGKIQSARLVALGCWQELDLRLCHEPRGLDVPGSKQCRAAQLKAVLSDKHN